MPKKYEDLNIRLGRLEAILSRLACDTCRNWNVCRIVRIGEDGRINWENRPDVCPACGKTTHGTVTVSVAKNVNVEAI